MMKDSSQNFLLQDTRQMTRPSKGFWKLNEIIVFQIDYHGGLHNGKNNCQQSNQCWRTASRRDCQGGILNCRQ